MTSEDASRRITVVGWLFVAEGVMTAAQMVWALFHGSISLNIAVLGIWIGRGLIRREERWRRWGMLMLIIAITIALLGLALIFVARMPAPAEALGLSVGPISLSGLLAGLAIPLAIHGWEAAVLANPVVKAQFAARAEPVAEPQPPL